MSTHSKEAISLTKRILKQLSIIALFITCPYIANAVNEPSESKVNCYCETKEVLSWCGTEIGDDLTFQWEERPFVKDKEDWDDQKLRSYCYRKSDSSCLCDDESLYSGELLD